MAVYALVKPGQPIRNGVAVGLAPQPGSTQGVALQATGHDQEITGLGGQAAVLDGRYKAGGTTGWERPGSNLP